MDRRLRAAAGIQLKSRVAADRAERKPKLSSDNIPKRQGQGAICRFVSTRDREFESCSLHRRVSFDPSCSTRAGDRPTKWTKQVASHFGGTRQGMAISWPARIKDAGGIRGSWTNISRRPQARTSSATPWAALSSSSQLIATSAPAAANSNANRAADPRLRPG
jgi:hypothetical protein